MKRNAKKTVVVIALIALMAIPSMMAYFTDTETATNTFTTGNVEITLAEGITEALDVVPNQLITTATTVTNVGDNPAYVFVKYTDENAYFDVALTDDWTAVEGETNLYAYTPNKTFAPMEADSTKAVTVFDSIRVKKTLVSTTHENKEGVKVVVDAYAIQADWLDDDATAKETSKTAKEVWSLYTSPVTQ